MSNKYALIIANTEYNDPSLAQLTAPGRDAEDFARVLRDKEIGAFDDVKILLNNPEPQVREAVDEFFDQKKPDDLLVLYFSGHGVRDEMGSLYLALKNTTRARLRATALKSDFIREAMDQSRSKRVVLILDCCNSGAFAQGTKAMTGGNIGTASAFEGTGHGRIVLTASDSTQFAWEGDKVIGGDVQNSLFTHFLIKGLEGEADKDGNGQITIDELYDYAYGEIVQRTPKQTPGKWSYKQQGEILLVQDLRPKHVKPIALPKELSDAIEDTRTFVREGAVDQLRKILDGKNLGLAVSARTALEKIAAEDDSRHVAQAAAQALENIHQKEQLAVQKKEEERPRHGDVTQEETVPQEIQSQHAVANSAAIKKMLYEGLLNAQVLIARIQPKIVLSKSQKKIGFVALAVVAGLIIITIGATNLYRSTQNTNATSTAFLLSQYTVQAERAQATSTQSASYHATYVASQKGSTATAQIRKTATAQAARKILTATMQAQLTQTAGAVATEKAYWNSAKIVDTFNNNDLKWWTGNIETSYYTGSQQISQGQFLWTVSKGLSKDGFSHYSTYSGSTSKDFDVKIDTKRITGTSVAVCSGLIFREQRDQTYYFIVCDNGYYEVKYIINDNWSTLIRTKSETINSSDWNTMRVSARGAKFDFYINGILVYHLTNFVSESGDVGFAINVHNDEPCQVAFDNFYLINH